MGFLKYPIHVGFKRTTFGVVGSGAAWWPLKPVDHKLSQV